MSRTFQILDRDVKYKSGRFALRKAANIVADAARAGALKLDDHETAQVIAKNVAVQFSPRRFKKTGDLMFRVGIRGGARALTRAERNFSTTIEGKKSAKFQNRLSPIQPGGDTFYWRFLEFGTVRIGARPFMRPALKRNIQAATNEFTTQFQKAIDRAARKASGGA